MNDPVSALLNWLIGDSVLFGLTVQNWIPVFGGALLLYVAVLVIARQRQHGVR